MELLAWILFLVLMPVIGFQIWRVVSNQSSIQNRLQSQNSPDDESNDGEFFLGEGSLPGISGWLFRAGLRSPSAPIFFWTLTLSLFTLGLVMWFRLDRLGAIDSATDFIRSIPGGVGNVMVPFALSAPWFFIVVLTLAPTLFVRSIRQRRVLAVEQDLPLFLDLLNTLAQAGVGFDAALDRVLDASSSDRPLAMELRIFQADTLAGRSRVHSLQRLMHRVKVPVFSTFISAILQAEQVGAGMGETLRVQAKEMRARRREKASAAAMAVPTLLVLPMVIGFLPGIFVVLLGPMIFQAFGAMGQTLRGVTGQ